MFVNSAKAASLHNTRTQRQIFNYLPKYYVYRSNLKRRFLNQVNRFNSLPSYRYLSITPGRFAPTTLMPTRLYNNLTVLNRVPKYNKVAIAYRGPV